MRTLASLTIWATLSACAPLPHDAAPQQALLDETALGLAAAPEDVDWPREHWWAHYHDPQLDALIQDALAGHPSISEAQARLALASAHVEQRTAAQAPRVEAQAQASREKLSSRVAAAAPYVDTVRTEARLGVGLQFDMDLFGRLDAELKAALSEQQRAAAERLAADAALAHHVVQRYLEFQEAVAQEDVLARVHAQREHVLQLTQRRTAGGLDTLVHVRQAESGRAAAQVSLLQARTRVAQLRNALAALTGQGPSRGAALAARQQPQFPRQVPSEVPLTLLGRRADVLAARWRVEAALHRIDAAKARFYPNINLSAFAGLHALGLGALLHPASRAAQIEPAITLPLFDAGALRASLRGRQAEAAQAAAAYNETVLSAVHQVADLLAALRHIEEERVQQALARHAVDEAYRLAVDRYEAGLGDYLSVLSAQEGVLSQAQLDTRLHYHIERLHGQLAHALGGGLPSLPPPPSRSPA